MTATGIIPVTAASDREIDEVYGNKQVALANALIQAREKTSLLESKIELLAIYKVGNEKNSRIKKDISGKEYSVHYVEIPSREIRLLMGAKKNSGSLYGHIEAAAMELKKKLYIYRDKGSEQFTMKSLYGDVTYDKGRLTIDFNPETEYLFLDLKDNYSRVMMDIAFKFQTNGGFQLYKLLKSFVYNLPDPDVSLDQKDFPCLKKEYTLSELRLQLGYVDLNQPEIQKESSKLYPDADRLSSLEKKPKYRRWNDFYNRVIEPGIREINRISDIYIDSIEKERSAHGKVDGAVIRVQHNRNYYLNHGKHTGKSGNNPETAAGLSEEQVDEFIDEMRILIKEPLKTKDLKSIANVSGYDINKIRAAYSLSEDAGNIDNIVGWLISAIKNGYSSSTPVRKSGKRHFELEREYDFEKLEKELAERHRNRH